MVVRLRARGNVIMGSGNLRLARFSLWEEQIPNVDNRKRLSACSGLMCFFFFFNRGNTERTIVIRKFCVGRLCVYDLFYTNLCQD